jgi:hypothetical protein
MEEYTVAGLSECRAPIADTGLESPIWNRPNDVSLAFAS